MTNEKLKTNKAKPRIDMDKVFLALDNALEEAKSGKFVGTSAADAIRLSIDKIEALAHENLSLRQIYEVMGSEKVLGISKAYFEKVVRDIRKEVGSPSYKPRGERKKAEKPKETASPTPQTPPSAQTAPKPAPAAPVVAPKPAPAPVAPAPATPAFKCQQCPTARPMDLLGETVYRCSHCGTVYAAGADGKISTKIKG